jgi:hypothetical protein
MDGESGVAEERDSMNGKVARRAAIGRSRKARMEAPLDGEIVRRNGVGRKEGEEAKKRDGNTEFTEKKLKSDSSAAG